MRKQIRSSKGAPPKGIYSPAILAEGRFVFVSGQGPVIPESGEFLYGSFNEQARLTFNNLTALLEASGTSWKNAVKVGVFLSDLAYFPEMNQIYKEYLTEPYPARTTVQTGLPEGTYIEVDCIALVPDE